MRYKRTDNPFGETIHFPQPLPSAEYRLYLDAVFDFNAALVDYYLNWRTNHSENKESYPEAAKRWTEEWWRAKGYSFPRINDDEFEVLRAEEAERLPPPKLLLFVHRPPVEGRQHLPAFEFDVEKDLPLIISVEDNEVRFNNFREPIGICLLVMFYAETPGTNPVLLNWKIDKPGGCVIPFFNKNFIPLKHHAAHGCPEAIAIGSMNYTGRIHVEDRFVDPPYTITIRKCPKRSAKS